MEQAKPTYLVDTPRPAQLAQPVAKGKPWVLYLLYVAGTLLIAAGVIGCLWNFGAMATTVEGPSAGAWLQPVACGLTGILLLGLASGIELLCRIADAVEKRFNVAE